jgi:hypothetical protein
VLLCSDGLTDLVDDTEILAALQKQEQDVALRQLTDLANQRGGHDNITVIALRLPALVPLSEPDTLIITPKPDGQAAPTIQMPRVPQPSQMKRQPRKTATWLLPVVGLLLLALIALLIGGAYWLYSSSISTPGAITSQPLVSQAVTLPVLATTAPGLPSTAPTQPTLLSPSGSGGTPFFPTPIITLTPWPTNTSTP